MSLFVKIGWKLAELWPSEIRATPSHMTDFGLFLPILGPFLKIHLYNLRCPSFVSRVPINPICSPFGHKLSILTHKNHQFSHISALGPFWAYNRPLWPRFWRYSFNIWFVHCYYQDTLTGQILDKSDWNGHFSPIETLNLSWNVEHLATVRFIVKSIENMVSLWDKMAIFSQICPNFGL